MLVIYVDISLFYHYHHKIYTQNCYKKLKKQVFNRSNVCLSVVNRVIIWL